MKIGGGGVWQQLVMCRIILAMRFYRIQDTGYCFVPDNGYRIQPDTRYSAGNHIIPDIRYIFRCYNHSSSFVCSLNPIRQTFIPQPLFHYFIILSPLFFIKVSEPIRFELRTHHNHLSFSKIIRL